MQVDQLDVYTNTLSIIQDLIDRYDECDIRYSQYRYAQPIDNFEYNTVYLKQPKNKYRLYVKSRRYSDEEKVEFGNFLRKQNVRMSASLSMWLNNYEPTTKPHLMIWSRMMTPWAWSHYHFDYDDETIITMLALRFDNVIGKVCKIEKR
jgi:hypothetical protein